jgi:hypothetical protein
MSDINKAFDKIKKAFKKLDVIEKGLKNATNKIGDAANQSGKALAKVKEVPGMIERDSKKIVNSSINGVKNSMNKLKKGVSNVGKAIKKTTKKAGDAIKKVEKVPGLIESTANFIFVEQIGGFFQKFIRGLEYGLVEPLEVFFVGLGKVFMGIFGILFLVIQ